MKLRRTTYDPMAAAEFCEDAFHALGALTERTWHDRLQVVAEGRAARVVTDGADLIETELRFIDPAEPGPRDAAHQIFPGCPLMFRLAEALRPVPPVLERAALRPFGVGDSAPAADVAERLWHAQLPGCDRWRLEAPFARHWHFSLLALVRSEIQAIEQHWYLNRLAVSLPSGESDDALAHAFDLAALDPSPTREVSWPAPALEGWLAAIQIALQTELDADLEPIRRRQTHYLRRELGRIDEYFDGYERELRERAGRAIKAENQLKLSDRLAAAHAERERRRLDQVQRHEMRVSPHLDALVLVAEPAWRTRVSYVRASGPRDCAAWFVPRSRRWHQAGPP